MTATIPALIVAYDGSPQARRALDHAATLAGPGGELTVINVVPTQAVGSRLETIGEAARARQQAQLNDARSVLTRAGIRVRTVAAAGDPLSEIVGLACYRSEPLIVVGRRRRALPGRSLATRLVRMAPCDVLVVP